MNFEMMNLRKFNFYLKLYSVIFAATLYCLSDYLISYALLLRMLSSLLINSLWYHYVECYADAQEKPTLTHIHICTKHSYTKNTYSPQKHYKDQQQNFAKYVPRK